MSKIYLEHALLDVTDVGRSVAFYNKLIPDWVVRWEGPTMEGGRWIHLGPPGDHQPGYLSLYETPGAQPGDTEGLRIEHIGFAHPDLEALVARLSPLGITPSDKNTRRDADDGEHPE